MLTSAKIGIPGWYAIYKHDRVSQLIYMLLNKIPSQWYDFHTASKVLSSHSNEFWKMLGVCYMQNCKYYIF